MRQTVLSRLAGEFRLFHIGPLAAAVSHLDPSLEERELARARMYQAALDELDVETATIGGTSLVEQAVRLAVTEQERAQVRAVLLAKLAHTSDASTLSGVLKAIPQLAATEEDQIQVRVAVLKRLNVESDPFHSRNLISALALLNPTIPDLSGAECWAQPPTWELLATVRQNSDLLAWLAALPRFSTTRNNM